MLEKDTIRRWVEEKVGTATGAVQDDQPIFTSGMLDSFDLVELVTFVEQCTGRRVKALEINMRNFDTVNQVAAFGDRLMAT